MGKERRKPVVGETLYTLYCRSYGRHAPNDLTKVTVSGVGRKYFRVKAGEHHREDEFSIDTWSYAGEHARKKIYESEQEYLDEVECDKLINEIGVAIRDLPSKILGFNGFCHKLPAARLRQILETIRKLSVEEPATEEVH